MIRGCENTNRGGQPPKRQKGTIWNFLRWPICQLSDFCVKDQKCSVRWWGEDFTLGARMEDLGYILLQLLVIGTLVAGMFTTSFALCMETSRSIVIPSTALYWWIYSPDSHFHHWHYNSCFVLPNEKAVKRKLFPSDPELVWLVVTYSCAQCAHFLTAGSASFTFSWEAKKIITRFWTLIETIFAENLMSFPGQF